MGYNSMNGPRHPGKEGLIMRVLLISGNREQINMLCLPLGLALVAEAAHRAGHQVHILDLLDASDPAAAIAAAVERRKPELIGVSVRNVDDQNMAAPRMLLGQAREVVSRCKELSPAPVVVGGAGYAIFPQAALAYLGADLGLTGDGELALPALLERLAAGRDPAGLPGLHLPGRSPAAPGPAAAGLDLVPMEGVARWLGRPGPDDDIWLPVQSRRGCPMSCTYCTTPLIEGRVIRRRDPAAFAAGLARLVQAGFDRFYFTDNVFNLPPSYALALCRNLAGIEPRPRWRCILHPARLDPELAAAMAEAGCVEASLGFESGSERMLRVLGKGFTPEQVRSARRLLRQHGIRCMGFLLLGGPGEDRRSVARSLSLAEELELDLGRLTVGIRIYPGTALAATARGLGAVAPDDDLLRPRFFRQPGLEEWLPETLARWREHNPGWIM